MEKAKKIIALRYTGEVDAEGLPHGKGELRYVVEHRPDDTFQGQGDCATRVSLSMVSGMATATSSRWGRCTTP